VIVLWSIGNPGAIGLEIRGASPNQGLEGSAQRRCPLGTRRAAHAGTRSALSLGLMNMRNTMSESGLRLHR
jgi:hypothetical protein